MQGEKRTRSTLGFAAAIAALVLLGVAWWWFASSDAAVSNLTATKPATAAPALESPRAAAEGERVEQSSSQPESARAADSAPTPPATGRDAQRLFFGRAVDADGEAPIADAKVSLALDRMQSSSSPTAPDLPSAKSDSRGLFEIRLDADIGAHGWIDAVGFSKACFKIDDAHATPELALMLRLRRAGELEVHVLNVATGPLSGAQVSVSTRGFELAQPEGSYLHAADPAWQATTDASGVATLRELAVEVPLKIELTLAGAQIPTQFDDIVLARGEKRVLELTLGGSSRITGVVVDEKNEPVAKQIVWLSNHVQGASENTLERVLFYSGDGNSTRAQTTTDEQGRFTIEDVPRGSWWIGPGAVRQLRGKLDERAVCGVATRIEIDGRRGVDLTLRTQRGLFITAKVFDPNGEPTSTAIMGRADGELGGFLLSSNRVGDVCAIGPLMPGRYYIHAFGSAGACDSEDVLVEAGARDVELHLRAGASIHCTTIDALTRAPTACRVYVTHSEPDDHAWLPDSSGTFEVNGIPGGRYDLAASTADGRCGIVRGVEVKPGTAATNIEIALQPAARLRVAYTGPDKYAHYSIFEGGTKLALDGIHSQVSKTHSVPAGRIRVEVRMGSRPPQSRELDVGVGEERSVEFKFD